MPEEGALVVPDALGLVGLVGIPGAFGGGLIGIPGAFGGVVVDIPGAAGAGALGEV